MAGIVGCGGIGNSRFRTGESGTAEKRLRARGVPRASLIVIERENVAGFEAIAAAFGEHDDSERARLTDAAIRLDNAAPQFVLWSMRYISEKRRLRRHRHESIAAEHFLHRFRDLNA